MIAGASVALIGLAIANVLSASAFDAAIAIALFGIGMLSPNVIHNALQPMSEMAGVATAVLRGIQMVFAGISSALVGALHGGKAVISTAGVMAIFALTSLIFQHISTKNEKKLAA